MRTLKYRMGELFCGPGGLALGAIRASVMFNGVDYGITHGWASDYDVDACSTYRNNICPDRPESVIHADVRELDIESLPPIDCFAYGFPCNDFSTVGKHAGCDGKYGLLYRYGIHVLDIHRPLFFVAENVEGLVSANGGKDYERIIGDMASAGPGYKLTSHVYKFEDYGVPQIRHRVIIVGVSVHLGWRFDVPSPTTPVDWVTTRRTLEHPPIPDNAPNNEIPRHSKTVVKRLRHIRPGENVWTANLPDRLKLNVKNVRMSNIYRRLDPDLPAYTLTAKGGGGTHGYHYSEDRALTNRERARIQTFPDDFRFEGSTGSVRNQIGMAVPPIMAELIFTSLLMQLALNRG